MDFTMLASAAATDLDHARALVKDRTPRELSDLLNQVHVQTQYDDESAKPHPLRTLVLMPEDWAAMKAHLLDGGGVQDDTLLHPDLLKAIQDDDQATVWPVLVHLAKAALKRSGMITPVPGSPGAVQFGPVGRNRRLA